MIEEEMYNVLFVCSLTTRTYIKSSCLLKNINKNKTIASLLFLGTWQTYMVKEQSVWHKVDRRTPVEYAASVFVNPLTALRMLEDFVDLKPGASILTIMLCLFWPTSP